MFFLWPDTNGLPLEEIAAIFGDADEVAIYQAEITIDHNAGGIVVHRIGDDKESGGADYVEDAGSEKRAVEDRV
jgi:hypothetical protein